ncbi:glycosyltransferase [Sediminibacillus halophilus]|uniref:Glycosyl transferases group 1 n=1 Tax=Sediminibacillus halophilus TaxID=482461 RepID=A0A1G9N6F0_9BACI|nr:glycosyltransferase [Sediminibacillus halophilus]SDL82058.1 Glycosyl transferases group 1 [Sediminibacillus halophilus]
MKVILATPNYHQQRGNTVTVQRISKALHKLNIQTEIVSITSENQQKDLPAADLLHGFHAYRFYQFLKQLRDKPKTYMITITGTDLSYYLYEDTTRADTIASLTGASAIHVFNKEARSTLLKEIPGIAEKIHVIPQGTDEFQSDGDKYEKEPGTTLFVLPAGIRKVKNVPAAIQMMKKLHSDYPTIRLALVGPILEEEEGSAVEKLVAENNHWVSYLGQIDHEKMGSIYRSADVLLNTSIAEGQPSAILEAMAVGIPVLVSDNQGNRSIVSHEENGFIYHNENEFLAYAEKIMNNNHLRQSIGQAAAHYISESHSSQQEAKKLLEIYKQLS